MVRYSCLMSSSNSEPDTSLLAEAGAKVVEAYNKLTRRIEELGLPESIDEKPLLNVRNLSTSSCQKADRMTGKRNHQRIGCIEERALVGKRIDEHGSMAIGSPRRISRGLRSVARCSKRCRAHRNHQPQLVVEA